MKYCVEFGVRNGAHTENQVMHTREQAERLARSLGRNHYTADLVTMTDFGDCFRVNIRWNDGALVYVIYETKEEALNHVYRLGWS